MSRDGKYDDNYFELNKDERVIVDSRAEDVFISSRILSLACNKAHHRSKQELQNDLVKGKHNYPTTFAEVMKFMSHHNLRQEWW